jgi:hypothetical protein
MTYNLGATKSGPYDTDGVQTVFAYGFKCYAKTDLEAIYTTAAGAESVMDASGYSMDGLGNDSGGNVTFTGAPTGGGKVTFRLAPLKEQQTNLRNQGAYNPESVERMGDRTVMLLLSLAEEVSRAVKVDISSEIDSTEYLAAAQSAADSAAASADVSGSYATASGVSASAAAVSAAAAAAAGAGLKYLSVRAATTANGALATAFANGQVIDGITLATNDRILLKNQSAPAENGVYTVNATGAPTRATDMDIWVEVVSSVVIVSVGTTNANSVWLCTSNSGGTLGVTAITFIDYGSTIVNGTLTLAKFAAIAANTLIGNVSGASATPIATVVTPGTFLARASTGNIGTKTISDNALAFLAAVNYAAMRTALGSAASGANTDITTIVASRPINNQTGTTYTLVLGDAGKCLTLENASPFTCTIPPNSSVAFPVGTEIDVIQIGNGQVTFAQGAGVTIASKSSNKKLTGIYSAATIKKTATDTWVLVGDLAA